MFLCNRFLIFLAITLAKVSAHYHYLITFYVQNGQDENSRRPYNSVEFYLPYRVISGWCAPEPTNPKNVSGIITRSGKTAPWYCTFYAMMNRSANCITTFHTAEKNSKYVVNIEKDTMFNIESNETESQINIKSSFTIDLGRCALNGTMGVNRYYADSMIILDQAGKWFCKFYIQRRRPVNIFINLRSSEHNRIYKTVDGKEPILITQEPEDRELLTMTNIRCANNLSIIRPNLNSSYISLDNSEPRNDTWECNFHNHAINTICIFKVRDTLPSNNYMGYQQMPENTAFAYSEHSMTMTHVLLSFVGVAALIIILLICVICYYKSKVKKFEENVVPPNIVGRAPFETPPEIVYDCVYSHPAGLKRPGTKKQKNTDEKQLIDQLQ